jgi:hypothetical protein
LVGHTANEGATRLSNLRQSEGDYNRLNNQTRSDIRATGTGKIADEKASVNDALTAIANALSDQAAAIQGKEATAQSSYRSQLQQMAGAIQAQHTATDPNSPDNLLKLSQAAKNYGSIPGATGTVSPGTPSTGSATAVPAGPGQAPIVAPAPAKNKSISSATDYLAQNVKPSHFGTDEGLFRSIINGNVDGALPGGHIQLDATSNATIGELAQKVHAAIQARSGQGYGPVDQEAILRALYGVMGLG